MLRPRTKPTNLITSINLTGFLSIMIVLFFTVLFADPGPLYMHSGHHGIGTDLPKVNHPVLLHDANREDALILAIMRDSKVFFQREQVTLDQLPDKIRAGIKQGSENKIYIRADALCCYGTVKRALDAIRDAGIQNIAFLTDQRLSTPNQGQPATP